MIICLCITSVFCLSMDCELRPCLFLKCCILFILIQRKQLIRQKFGFPPFKGNMTDRLTNQPTDRPGSYSSNNCAKKFNFQLIYYQFFYNYMNETALASVVNLQVEFFNARNDMKKSKKCRKDRSGSKKDLRCVGYSEGMGE